ncbi:MAG: FAD:protein FMN transferase [Gallionella sp.]|nr:FAD:protein FMN transferase [Gallionella sp.]MCK9354031.1 FAD:protein FMN transferase [Gallionella sp.]
MTVFWARRFFILSMIVLLSACGKEPLYHEQGYVFGTLVDVSIYGEDEAKARTAVGEVLQEFQRLHDELHAWQPSELSELNAAFAKGEGKAVSPELAAMLRDAAQLSAQSEGLFNPAIGGLIGVWGFQSDEFKPLLPDAEKVAALVKTNPQMGDIVFDGDKVSSRNRAVQLDLGGYAKGYALDRAAELLRKRGIRNALVNIGGNVMALGRHGDRPWRVGIQHPRKSGALASLELHDGEAIGTSGDYQRYFELDGKRYCHLIDPRSGWPVQGVQAVTVLTRGERAGLLSDAASKPLFVAGKDGWRAAAQRMQLPEAMLVDAQGGIHLTAALQKRLEFADKNIRVEVLP